MSQGAKPASQARSRQTRDKLVTALERLLQERDFDSISISDLASEAGLAVGTVYRRFENKDAFIPVIFELYRTRLDARMASPEGQAVLEPGAGLKAGLRQIVGNAWAFIQTDGHLIRAAHLYARLRPDLVGEDWSDLLDQSIEGARRMIESFPDEIRVSDKDIAAQIFIYLLNPLPVEKGLYGDDGVGAALNMDDETFLAALVDTMYGYLTTPSEPAAE